MVRLSSPMPLCSPPKYDCFEESTMLREDAYGDDNSLNALGSRPFLPPPRPIWAPMHVARRRPADHRRRGGMPHHRPERARKPRRLCGSVLRQCWLWAGQDRGCDRAAGLATRLLPCLCRPWQRGGDHPFADDHRPCAERHEPSLLWALRLGCQRDQHQAGLVLQQHPRAPGEEEEVIFALARLSRLPV